MWFQNRSDTNQAVQAQKMARDWKFWIWKVEELYYPCSANKGADQLRGYREADLRLCFRLCRLLVFPWGCSNVLAQEKCKDLTVYYFLLHKQMCLTKLADYVNENNAVNTQLLIMPCKTHANNELQKYTLKECKNENSDTYENVTSL